MRRLIAQRAALAIVTLLVISALLFFCTNLLPGDVATALLGQEATPEALAALRESLGLDQPAIVRYGHWLWGAVQGDFGVSLASGRPVSVEVLPRLGNTLALAGLSAIVAVPLAVALGVWAAVREGKLIDRLTSMVSLMAVSVPEFLVGYVLILVFAVQWGGLPSLSIIPPGIGVLDWLRIMTLPVLSLVLMVVAHILRITRASLLAVMNEPYVEMAFLKGVPRRTVVLRHALPNAAAPIIAVVALNLGYLVVGVVVVETVFVYPGAGQLMVDAVSKRDLPVVQACGLVFAATYVLLNALGDIAAMFFNPRLKHA